MNSNPVSLLAQASRRGYSVTMLKLKLNKKDFKVGLEELKRQIIREVAPFPDDTRAKRMERVKRGRKSIEFFAKIYFPHYCTKPFSRLHKDIFKYIKTTIADNNPHERGMAAPRGNAKTTIISQILPIWCMAFNLKHFIGLFSDTFNQSADNLEYIKAELEANPRLKHDFPHIYGVGLTWQYGVIITRNNIKVKSWGTRQRLRGAKHGPWRPDLCIYDDLENDENVVSQLQREKSERWFFRGAMNLGSLDYTDHIAIGTIIHYDSLLQKIINRLGGNIYKAVLKWSEAKQWEKWKEIWQNDGPGRKKALEYFKKHRKIMLTDTQVLWPEGEDYYTLMNHFMKIGPAAFESEKQNEPLDKESLIFDEEWLYEHAYEPEELAGKDLIYYGGVDPSMGKNNTGCPSAIIGGAKDLETGHIFLRVDDCARRRPNAIIDRTIEYQRMYPFVRWNVESVQFQEFFKDILLQESVKQGIPIPAYGIPSRTDKDLRIQSMQPHIMNGVVRLPKAWARRRDNPMSLWNQLIHYPRAAYNDGPDALHMCLVSLFGVEAAVGSLDPEDASYRRKPISKRRISRQLAMRQ